MKIGAKAPQDTVYIWSLYQIILRPLLLTLFSSISFHFIFENVILCLLTTFSFHFQNEIIFTIHCYYSLHFYYFSNFTIHPFFHYSLHFYYSFTFSKFLSTFYFFPPFITIHPLFQNFSLIFIIPLHLLLFLLFYYPNVIFKMSFTKHHFEDIIFKMASQTSFSKSSFSEWLYF